jgi:hypothetical protein
MKWSDAVIKGYKVVNGKQCRGALRSYKTVKGELVLNAVCVIGAAQLGGKALADKHGTDYEGPAACKLFKKKVGIGVIDLNDNYKMKWEDIVGIAKAEGL